MRWRGNSTVFRGKAAACFENLRLFMAIPCYSVWARSKFSTTWAFCNVAWFLSRPYPKLLDAINCRVPQSLDMTPWKMPISGPDNLWFISLMYLIKILPLEHVEKKETSKQNHLEYAGMVRTISWNSVEPAYFSQFSWYQSILLAIFIEWKWVTWLLEMSMTCS